MSVHLSWITIFLGIPTVPRRGHHLQSDEASISFKIIIYSELVSLAFYCLAICLLGNTQLKRTWHHSLNKSQTNQIEAKNAICLTAMLVLQVWPNAGSHCHVNSSSLSRSQHLVYIIYSHHVAMLNYYIASQLSQNSLES